MAHSNAWGSFWQLKSLDEKWWKMLFISCEELFLFLTFLSRRFGYVEKELDKEAMVTFKIYEPTDWTVNNCKTYYLIY